MNKQTNRARADIFAPRKSRLITQNLIAVYRAEVAYRRLGKRQISLRPALSIRRQQSRQIYQLTLELCVYKIVRWWWCDVYNEHRIRMSVLCRMKIAKQKRKKCIFIHRGHRHIAQHPLCPSNKFCWAFFLLILRRRRSRRSHSRSTIFLALFFI